MQSREPLTLVAMALPLRARLPLCPPRRGPRLLARRVRPARRRWAAQAAPPHLPRSPPPPGGRWAAQQRWAGGGWCGGRTVPPPLSPCTPARRAGAVAGPLCTPLAAGAGGREGSAGGAPGESPRPGPEGGWVPIPRARSAFTFRSGFASNSYSWCGAAPGLWSTPRRRRRGQPCSGRQRPLKNSKNSFVMCLESLCLGSLCTKILNSKKNFPSAGLTLQLSQRRVPALVLPGLGAWQQGYGLKSPARVCAIAVRHCQHLTKHILLNLQPWGRRPKGKEEIWWQQLYEVHGPHETHLCLVYVVSYGEKPPFCERKRCDCQGCQGGF